MKLSKSHLLCLNI